MSVAMQLQVETRRPSAGVDGRYRALWRRTSPLESGMATPARREGGPGSGRWVTTLWEADEDYDG